MMIASNPAPFSLKIKAQKNLPPIFGEDPETLQPRPDKLTRGGVAERTGLPQAMLVRLRRMIRFVERNPRLNPAGSRPVSGENTSPQARQADLG